MKTKTKVKKTLKEINKFLLTCIKAHNTMTKKIKSYWLFTLILIVMTACGSTKVSVQKPAEGTSTTITVTTNNPVTTSTPITNELNK